MMPPARAFLAWLPAMIGPVFAQSTWSATSAMNAPHTQHPATLLPNGKVLVVGTLGCNPGCYSGSTAELYDPASDAWGVTGPPRLPRFNHIAELLPNGKVLVAGGYLTPGVLTGSSELYDPATGTWSSTGSLATPRQFHTSALLPGGKVLVAGGLGMDGQGSFLRLSSAEAYDPTTGRWSSAGDMSVPRAFNSMTTLSDGRVLVVGGSSDNGPPLQSAELYDPVTGTWTRAADLTKARRFQSATLLQNGKVVVAGGDDGTSGVQKGFASSELFGASVPAQGRITNFSAASLLDNGAVAAESLASAFGSDLASDTQTVRGSALPLTLAGISITVQDSAGMARPAPLMAVSKGQINYEVPSGTAPGTATVTIHSVTASQNGAAVASGNVLIAPVAPGVFSADGSGQGLAAAVVLRIKGDGTYSYDQIAQFDSTQQRFVAVPIDLGPPTDQVFLVLLGTGIRSRSELSSISATIGAATVGAAFAGPWPQFPGVDQVNLLLPRALAGSGEVEVSLSVDGLAANPVNVNIR